MNPSPASDTPVVVLLGNYPLDNQQSMLRFAELVRSRLEAELVQVVSISPRGCFGGIRPKGSLAKWLGYLDKYILFLPDLAWQLSRLKRKYPGRRLVVHICDHSNSVYAGLARKWFPVLITCHDLLAVRGALGEDIHCPASGFGKRLQAAILRGLGNATYIACVSHATLTDLLRLGGPSMAGRSEVVPLGLNYPYRLLAREEALQRLQQAGIDLPFGGYILHVGSGQLRKNRGALLFSVAQIKDSWPGKIIFAGEPLSAEELVEAKSLGLEDRVRGISGADNETLLALYNAAHALVYMSYAEGFGWPILEAQACGCPVICSNRTSVPEVAGEGALVCEPDDYAGIAADIQLLEKSAVRDEVIARGFKNVQTYTIERMMGAYVDIYRRIDRVDGAIPAQAESGAAT